MSDKRNFPAPFLDLLEHVLTVMPPDNWGDKFSALNEAAAAAASRLPRLCLGTYDTYDDFANLVTAHARTKGRRFVICQHGGSYGYSAAMPYPAEMEYRHDVYLTWGWRRHGAYQGNFVPLPAPRLSTYADRHKEITSEILFIGTCLLVLNGRLDFFPDFITYRRLKLNFLAALEAPILTALKYRPYPKITCAFDERAFIARHFPDVGFVDGVLEDSMLGCRLAVFDTVGTAFHTALAGNVPTIAYWDPSQWPIADQNASAFDALRAAKILFDSPTAAAAHLNDIHANVQGWWCRAHVQAARRAWCQENARTSRFWLLHWMAALLRL